MEQPYEPTAAENVDFMRDQNVHSGLDTVEALLRHPIWAPQVGSGAIRNAMLTQILVLLRDAIALAELLDRRITISEHVPAGFQDITHLITDCRNAACHTGSGRYFLKTSRISGIAFGKSVIGNLQGVELKGEFDDDVAFFWGSMRLYLNRNVHVMLHALRAALADRTRDEHLRRFMVKANG